MKVGAGAQYYKELFGAAYYKEFLGAEYYNELLGLSIRTNNLQLYILKCFLTAPKLYIINKTKSI